MKKTLLIGALAIVMAFAFIGCAVQKVNNDAQMKNIWRAALTSVEIQREPQQHFSGLNWGVEVEVQPKQPVVEETGWVFHLSGKEFFKIPTIQYVRKMGFVEMSSNSDYHLVITINQADVERTDIGSSISSIDLSISLSDASEKEVYTQKNISASVTRNTNAKKCLGEAYTQALEQINWNRIASFLRTEQLAKDEPQKQVQGLGNTALEQTIIRWEIQSRPQGADVEWRVVSKTPDVKSTNNKYLQTTPWEATKSLDIKGLTYQNSGDVRIILRCQKDGYMTQEKEFNVRMVLDQEEISAFFRLVKEE